MNTIQQPSGSPYHTILPVDSQSGQSWNFIAQWKQFRSNSWSDSLDDCRIVPALDLNRFVFNRIESNFIHLKWKIASVLWIKIIAGRFTTSLVRLLQTRLCWDAVSLESTGAQSQSFEISKREYGSLSGCWIRYRVHKLFAHHQSTAMQRVPKTTFKMHHMPFAS